MHPALSVIFFTVTAGAGYGVLFLLGLARLTRLTPEASPDQVTAMALVGLLLVTVGLLSSTLHLANPRNAWRSFTRFKTSWLSREAVFAVLFYPVCLIWLLFEWFTGNTVATNVSGVLTSMLAIVVLVCTAMIYASLKTIRQWHTALTPFNFVLLGLLLGALILNLMLAQQGLTSDALEVVSLVLLLLAGMVKIIYFYWIGQPAGPTINTALGFTRATVRLLDVGHSSDTFHTKEFGYQVERIRLIWLRAISVGLAFVIPLLIVTGLFGPVNLPTMLLAVGSAYAGVLVERWLFFAEARHVVNLYHGAQRT
ncbi:MAG: dimethyl sulfoxide reductase anchor subunit [Granulosicoccus sp.]|nr:dimethyl sulfoxide reductase anchor subunit [Granulosicoccus sp.]